MRERTPEEIGSTEGEHAALEYKNSLEHLPSNEKLFMHRAASLYAGAMAELAEIGGNLLPYERFCELMLMAISHAKDNLARGLAVGEKMI